MAVYKSCIIITSRILIKASLILLYHFHWCYWSTFWVNISWCRTLSLQRWTDPFPSEGHAMRANFRRSFFNNILVFYCGKLLLPNSSRWKLPVTWHLSFWLASSDELCFELCSSYTYWRHIGSARNSKVLFLTGNIFVVLFVCLFCLMASWEMLSMHDQTSYLERCRHFL